MRSSSLVRNTLTASLLLGMIGAAPVLAYEDDDVVTASLVCLGDDAQVRVITSDVLGDDAIAVLCRLCKDAKGEPRVIRLGNANGPIAILLADDASGGASALAQWVMNDKKSGQQVIRLNDGEGEDEHVIVIKQDDGNVIRLDGNAALEHIRMKGLGDDGEKDVEAVIVIDTGDGNVIRLDGDDALKHMKKMGKGGGAWMTDHVGAHGVIVIEGEGDDVEWFGEDGTKRVIKLRKGGDDQPDLWFGDGNDQKKVIKRRVRKGGDDPQGTVWFGDGEGHVRVDAGGDSDGRTFVFKGDDGKVFEFKGGGDVKWHADDDGKNVIKRRVRKGGDGEDDQNVFFFEVDGDKPHGQHIEIPRIHVSVEIPGMEKPDHLFRKHFGKGGPGEIEVIVEGLGDMGHLKGHIHELLMEHMGGAMEDLDIEFDFGDAMEGMDFEFEFDPDMLHEHLGQHLHQHLKAHGGEHMEALKHLMEGQRHFETKLGESAFGKERMEQLQKHLRALGPDKAELRQQIEKELRQHIGSEDSPFGNAEARQRIEQIIRERLGDKLSGHSFEVHVDVEAEDEDDNPVGQRQETHDDDDREEALQHRINRLEDRIDRLTKMLERLMKERGR